MDRRGLLEFCEVIHEDVQPEIEDPILDIIETLVTEKMTGLQEDLEKAKALVDGDKGSKEDKEKIQKCIEDLETARAKELCEGKSPSGSKQGKEKLEAYIEYLEEVRTQELVAGELGSHLRGLEMGIKTHKEDLAEVNKQQKELGLSEDEKKYFEKKKKKLERSIEK